VLVGEIIVKYGIHMKQKVDWWLAKNKNIGSRLKELFIIHILAYLTIG